MIPIVSIIILNKESYQDTLECLESIGHLDYPKFNVIVIDNASENDSVERILKWVLKNCVNARVSNESPIIQSCDLESSHLTCETIHNGRYNGDWKLLHCRNGISIISCNENNGFAEGNNIGIRYAMESVRPDYLLLLNNDTVVDKAFLTQLVRVAENNKEIGIAGPAIYHFSNPDKIQSIGMRINWWLGEMLDPRLSIIERINGTIIEVDAISGCAMLIKREVFDEIDLLSRDFLLYYEDIDLCIRARKSGYTIVCVPSSRIWHKLSSTARRNAGTREYYSARNLFIFMRKHAKPGELFTFRLYFCFFKLWLWAAVIAFHHREAKPLTALLRGAFEGIRSASRKES